MPRFAAVITLRLHLLLGLLGLLGALALAGVLAFALAFRVEVLALADDLPFSCSFLRCRVGR